MTSPRSSATLAAMWAIVTALLGALGSAFKPRASLVAENLALRQQLATLRREVPRPHLRLVDRAFWVLLSRIWSRWTEVLAIVQPATVIAWHRRGFARFWTWKSRRVGRPPLSDELVQLIEKMALPVCRLKGPADASFCRVMGPPRRSIMGPPARGT